MTEKGNGVKIGQVYKGNDPRTKGRRKIQVLSVGGSSVRVRNIRTGLESAIGKKRLLDTGRHGFTYVGSKRGRKPGNGPEMESVTFKVEKTVHRAMLAKARRHAKGNLSAWLRYTGVSYRMKKGEKVKKVEAV